MVLRDLASDVFRFGHFTLEPQRRLLSIDGNAIAVSSRAFDILLFLIEQRDRVVTKDEIFARVWPGMIVEENNLAVQISALRRALGEQPGDPKLIMTIPGRGYRFVGTLEQEPVRALEAPAEPSLAALDSTLPPFAPTRIRLPAVAWIGLAACVILAIAGARYAWRGAYTAPRLSIAILPFRNLSGDAQQDYLADAITDDLTTDLSHIPGSTVIARESSDTYKNHPAPTPDIGRALNVRYLLEGSLRIEANTYHVNAQLIDAPTSAHLWAARFDVTRDKLGVAQEDIVRHIASALNFTLVQVEATRSLHERPNNPDAVDFYLRARSLLDQGASMASLTAAQGLLEKAVAAAPGFTDAMAELGLVLLQKVADNDDPDEIKDHDEAGAVIRQAVTLAPRNAAAITAQGMLAWEDDHCDQAEPSFSLALSLDPNDVRALNGLAHCSHDLGLIPQMIDEFRQMLNIDPLSPATPRRQYDIGVGYLLLNKPAEAVKWFNLSGPEDETANSPLGWQEWRRLYIIAASQELGESKRAADLYAEYRKRWPHRTTWQLAAYDSPVTTRLPGHIALLSALRAAGMPQFANEEEDFGTAPTNVPRTASDFEPTPLSIPGATRVNTTAVRQMQQERPPPAIIDVGHGAAVIPSAIWVWAEGLQGDLDRSLAEAGQDSPAARSRPIIVMSDGPFGWRGYNAALHLVAKGFSHVLWYRGGEQAWAEADYPRNDLRTP
jgi:TolB-like protein/DNA-binding winged helix-turn-helix (wHTH) protein/rhodanese-related sulfurtransferase